MSSTTGRSAYSVQCSPVGRIRSRRVTASLQEALSRPSPARPTSVQTFAPPIRLFLDARARRLARLWRPTSARSPARTWRSGRLAWRHARQPGSPIVRLCKPHSPRRSTQPQERAWPALPVQLDSYAGTPVDFQFLNGNLVRNAGLSPGLTRFDISLMKAIRIPKVGDRQSWNLSWTCLTSSTT